MQSNAKRAYKRTTGLKRTRFKQKHPLSRYRCGLCGGKSHSFHLHNAFELEEKKDEPENSVSRRINKVCFGILIDLLKAFRWILFFTAAAAATWRTVVF